MTKKTRIEKLFNSIAVICAAGFLLTGTAPGQSTLATLEGTVGDREGNSLPGALITVKGVDTGYEYHGQSRQDGKYVISGIEPGTYEVRADLSGFTAEIKQGLILNVSAKLRVDFKLSLEPLKSEISVIAATPMVEVAKSEISSVVDRRKIDDLPLFDSNFYALTFTKPGFQEMGGGSSNAQPYGSEEMLVDGVSNENVSRNVIHTQLPADAIEEFRVITNQYQAEFGNSSGMMRTAITRSGTNAFSGRVSVFSRDEAFDQVNYFVNHETYQGPELPEDQWQKPPYEHYRFGGYLGGPIKKNKAHFFLAYDGLRRTDYATITPSELVPKETVPRGADNDLALLKLSFQPSEKHRLSVRAGMNWLRRTNDGVGGKYTKERASDYEADIPEFQANWAFFLSANAMNELRLHYVKTFWDYSVLAPGSYTVNRPSGFFGKPSALPQNHEDRRYQIVDSVSVLLGDHSLKLGLDYSTIPMRAHVELGIPGLFYFTTDKPFNPADASTYPLYFYYNSTGFADYSYSYGEMGLFVQDSWRVHSRLTLNLGLRWNYYQVEHLDIDHSDIRNFNPRLGLSWDPFGDGKTALRAGLGTFSQNPQNNLSGLIDTMNKFKMRYIFYPNYPDPFAPNPFRPSVPVSSPPNTYESGKDMVPPTTVQATLGFERQLLPDFSASVDLVWSRGRHYTRVEDANPVIPGTGNVRKDPTKGALMIYADHGRTDYRAMYLVLNKRYSRRWSLEVSYTLSRSRADVETEQTEPNSYEDNAWERMYGPTNFDARHRLAVTGIVDLPWGFQLSGLFFYRSALPWTAFYATDVNKDSLVKDMVDWNRNSRRGFDYSHLNARLSYHLKVRPFVIQVFAEAYNITNRTNFWTISSVYGSDLFGKPLAADVPRLIQLGARIDF